MDLERLSRPEYLSDQELRAVLQSYNVSVTNDMSRCEVLKIFRKVGQPLPQRVKCSTSDTGWRPSTNANNKRDQEMDVDDYETFLKSKFSPQFVNHLENQFSQIVRISDSFDESEPIDIVSTPHGRKRLSESKVSINLLVPVPPYKVDEYLQIS